MKVNQAVSHNGSHQRMNKEPDPEVVPKARRRHFSVQYKLRLMRDSKVEKEGKTTENEGIDTRNQTRRASHGEYNL